MLPGYEHRRSVVPRALVSLRLEPSVEAAIPASDQSKRASASTTPVGMPIRAAIPARPSAGTGSELLLRRVDRCRPAARYGPHALLAGNDGGLAPGEWWQRRFTVHESLDRGDRRVIRAAVEGVESRQRARIGSNSDGRDVRLDRRTELPALAVSDALNGGPGRRRRRRVRFDGQTEQPG